MIFDPAAENPQNIYKLLIGAVVPRPIALVSSLSAEGVPNLAPFSFFNAVCADPPIICFAVSRPGAASGARVKKDTLANVEATGEFVVNIVSENIAGQMNLTAGNYPPEVDEFALAGFTPAPSVKVKPARAAESKVSFECRVHQIVTLSDRPMGGSLVLGEIVMIHAADAVVTDFRVDPELLQAIGRMGGLTYTRTRDRFDIVRPK